MIHKTAALALFMLLFSTLFVAAQTNDTGTAFDMTGFPQWAKDLRRWEIVAFGTFPFTMLMSTTAMDMYRWNNANGMDFSEAGRRYAPWPLKSAGAVAMDHDEMKRTIIMAAGLSAAIAVADLVIVLIKRQKERKRTEALPVGVTIITRTPIPDESIEAPQENAETEESEIDEEFALP